MTGSPGAKWQSESGLMDQAEAAHMLLHDEGLLYITRDGQGELVEWV